MSKWLFFLFVFLLPAAAQASNTSIRDLQKQLQANPDNILLREKISRAYAKNKQWLKVVELLNPNTDQATPRGLLQLCAAYEELKDYGNLVRILTLLSEKRPKDYQIHYLLGDAQLKSANITKDLKLRQNIENEAIESFRTSLSIKPNFKLSHQALVNYFLKVGSSHEAREQIGDMLKAFGPRAELHAELCRLYSTDGFLPQAFKHCQMAIRLNPKAAESYVYLSQTYFDQKDFEKSEKTIISAAKKFPHSEFVQYVAGQYFLTNNNYRVAAKYLKLAVKNDRTSARSHIAFANSLFNSNQAAEALPHFTTACELNSATQEEFLSAASKLRLKGETAMAQRYTQAANGCKK